MKKVTGTKNIVDMGILNALNAAFEGTIPLHKGPQQRAVRGEIRRGVVKSPIARRLYTISQALHEHGVALAKEHDALHQADGPKPIDHGCEAVHLKLDKIGDLSAAIDMLMHQAIAEEHPRMAFNRINLRKGWVLVSEKDDPWIEATLPGHEDSLFANFLDLLHNTVTGRHMEISEDGLDPVGAGEEVIASLEDERLQTLRTLAKDLKDELTKLLPGGLEAMDLKRIGELTINKYFAYKLLERHAAQLSEALSEVFWYALRESLPAVAPIADIGIRRAWEVVKKSPSRKSASVHPLEAILRDGRSLSFADLATVFGD